MILTDKEKDIAKKCVTKALEEGADQVRVSVVKSVADEYVMLDGEIDSVTHSADRSLCLEIFAGGRYGRFSTNRLDDDGLAAFIPRCVAAGMNMEADPDRHLPDIELCEKAASGGDEMGVTDPHYADISADERLQKAVRGCPQVKEGGKWKLVSCENSWCDSIEETYITDSNGAEAYKSETAYAVTCELTVEDTEGKLYEGGARSSSPFISGLRDPQDVTRRSLARATAKIGTGRIRSAKKRMVVDNTVGTRILGPLITALYGDMIYNGNSFLKDKLGEKVFPEILTIEDLPRSSRGRQGARMFDNEACSTADRVLIGNGVVRNYLLNTYYAAKLGMQRTAESVSVLRIGPCRAGTLADNKTGREHDWDRQAVIKAVGNGILVTGFNGGNCNPATGEYSYGVEGFVIRNGRIGRPVGGMLITGNMIELWQSLLAAGNDPKEYGSWAVPTLAFDAVSFSGSL